MCFGTKSDLLDCLYLVAPEQQGLTVDCIILDGAAVIQIHPIWCKKLADYAMKTFVPYILSHFCSVQTGSYVELIYYWPFESATRVKRGSGM
jgi:hypothetical protein